MAYRFSWAHVAIIACILLLALAVTGGNFGSKPSNCPTEASYTVQPGETFSELLYTGFHGQYDTRQLHRAELQAWMADIQLCNGMNTREIKAGDHLMIPIPTTKI